MDFTSISFLFDFSFGTLTSILKDSGKLFDRITLPFMLSTTLIPPSMHAAASSIAPVRLFFASRDALLLHFSIFLKSTLIPSAEHKANAIAVEEEEELFNPVPIGISVIVSILPE